MKNSCWLSFLNPIQGKIKTLVFSNRYIPFELTKQNIYESSPENTSQFITNWTRQGRRTEKKGKDLFGKSMKKKLFGKT